MKKATTLLTLLLTATIVCAQREVELITEDYVREVVTTLSSDAMMGRDATKPEQIRKASDYIESQFKSIGLTPGTPTGFRQEFTNKKMPGVSLNNVFGVLPGKSKPDEMVIFSAHYDHVGMQPAVAGDSVANGADDDASGCAAVIALAKYFKTLDNNERTLVFVTFTAEEVGGFGSAYFTEKIDPGKVIAMFNVEMIGKPSKWGKDHAFITGYELSNFGPILNMNVEGTKYKFMADPYPQEQLFYRSDNARLAVKGVPAHSISTDQIDRDPYYHTINDEVETLDIVNIVSTIRAIALGSRTIVSGEETPTRISKK